MHVDCGICSSCGGVSIIERVNVKMTWGDLSFKLFLNWFKTETDGYADEILSNEFIKNQDVASLNKKRSNFVSSHIISINTWNHSEPKQIKVSPSNIRKLTKIPSKHTYSHIQILY